MQKVKLTKVVLSQSELNKLNKKEKKRFIMFTFIMRDLDLLQKFLLYVHNNKPTDGPSLPANTTVSVFFLKTLISKIHEIWIFLDKNKILDESQKFPHNLKKSIDEIKQFFADKKVVDIFSFIRNKFGFHYEYMDDIDDLIVTALEEFDQYEAWLSIENSANQIFASSNAVILKVITIEMKRLGFVGDDYKELLNKLFDITFKVTQLFKEFSTSYLAEAFPMQWKHEEEMEIDAPLISEVKLPLIIAK